MFDTRLLYFRLFDIKRIHVHNKSKSNNLIEKLKKSDIKFDFINDLNKLNKKEMCFTHNRFKTNKFYQFDEFVVVPNFNNPKWIILNEKQVIKNHGKIIKPSKFTSKVLWKVSKLFNLFGLFDLLYPDKVICNKGELNKLFDKTKIDGSRCELIYTGSPGVYQKFTCKLVKDSIIYYCKLALQEEGKKRIKHEKISLNKRIIDNENIVIPEIIDSINNDNIYGIIQSNILNKNDLFLGKLCKLDYKFFNHLYNETRHSFISLINYIKKIMDNRYNKPFSAELISKFQENKIILILSHGDYIPWNRFINKNQLKIIDWEMTDDRPLYYDMVYFFCHTEFLMRNSSVAVLYYKIIRHMDYIDYSSKVTMKSKRIYILIILLEIYYHYKKNRLETKFIKKIVDTIIFLENEIRKNLTNEDTIS